MKKQIWLYAAALVALTSCNSKMNQFAAEYFTTNPNPLEVTAHQVPATVTGNIPAKFFPKNAVVTVTPYLVYGDNEKAATPFTYQGQDVRGNNNVISYERGGLMTMPVNFAYTPEMKTSALELGFTVDQKGKQYTLPRVKVADGVIATSTLVNAGDVDPALTPDKFQRIINEKYSADIRFLINQANVRQSETSSAEVQSLNQTLSDASKDAFREIRELNISSYASPEGGIDINTRLAENREKNTSEYLRNQLKKDNITEFGELTAQFTPEDWEGFSRLVATSNIQDKELILSVLSMYNDPEQREREIRNLSHVFEQLADEILPQLRRSRITASIDVIGKSDNEIAYYVDNSPKELTIDELLYAATLTDDAGRKAQIYDLATEQFPNDYRGYNNLGLLQYQAGDYEAASENFNKAARLAPTSAEVKMNQGLISLVNNNYNAANEAFGYAGGLDNLGEALGVYYLEKGDAAAAVKSFGDSKTNNAAVAQIMNGDYSRAKNTLESIKDPDAKTYYLKAITAARTGNAAGVLSNLNRVKDLDPEMAKQAASDLEFRNYKNLGL